MNKTNYIGIKEAAQRLGVTYQTARRYAMNGTIPNVVRIGLKYRIPISSIEKMLKPH